MRRVTAARVLPEKKLFHPQPKEKNRRKVFTMNANIVSIVHRLIVHVRKYEVK